MLLAGLAAGAVSAQTPVPYDFTAQNEPTNSIRTKSPEAPRPHSSALSFYTALKSNRPLSLCQARISPAPSERHEPTGKNPPPRQMPPDSRTGAVGR